LKRAIRIPSAAARRFLGYDKPIDILGSNFSAWKSDLVEVNGFNEALEAYWGEDGDLFIRLRNVGKKSRSAKGLCVQYHLFHKRREPSAENQARVSELLKRSDYKWATQGLT
jgi:GT2 family glycosyltransferase